MRLILRSGRCSRPRATRSSCAGYWRTGVSWCAREKHRTVANLMLALPGDARKTRRASRGRDRAVWGQRQLKCGHAGGQHSAGLHAEGDAAADMGIVRRVPSRPHHVPRIDNRRSAARAIGCRITCGAGRRHAEEAPLAAGPRFGNEIGYGAHSRGRCDASDRAALLPPGATSPGRCNTRTASSTGDRHPRGRRGRDAHRVPDPPAHSLCVAAQPQKKLPERLVQPAGPGFGSASGRPEVEDRQ